MYSVKRLKLFSGISDGRKSRDKHKYQLLNHIILFMLSSEKLDKDSGSDINEFSNILYTIRNSHKLDLDKYAVRYGVRYYSSNNLLNV